MNPQASPPAPVSGAAPGLNPGPASPDRCPWLDGNALAALIAGLLVILITFFTSYSHVDLRGAVHITVNQQIGIPLLVAAMAALFGEVKLASNSRCADQSARKREAHEADRERDRAARFRDRTTRQAELQNEATVAQFRFLLSATPRNRLQLSEALALLIEALRPEQE